MKLIILDRDGVINYDSDEFIKSPNEWQAIPGSLAAIARLNQTGYTVVVASNQSGIARGYFDWSTLSAIHDKMQHELSAVNGHIAKIYICPHGPDDHCECRKPKPGLIKQVAQDFLIELADTYVIGDALRDIQAGQSAGCKTILVRTGKGEKTLQENSHLKNTLVFSDLANAVEFIVKEDHANS